MLDVQKAALAHLPCEIACGPIRRDHLVQFDGPIDQMMLDLYRENRRPLMVGIRLDGDRFGASDLKPLSQQVAESLFKVPRRHSDLHGIYRRHWTNSRIARQNTASGGQRSSGIERPEASPRPRLESGRTQRP